MEKIIGWWSGGITSAVACKIAIDMYGVDNCRIIMIDTKNEHPAPIDLKRTVSSGMDYLLKLSPG